MFFIVDNIFEIENGDVMQICEDGLWTDLGTIKDKRDAAIKLAKHNFIIMNKPARVIRKKENNDE